MFMRRRRPLARAAMVGGVGYAGYRAGQNREASSQREYDEQARIEALEAQGAASAPPAGGGTDSFEALRQLADLHKEGVLTDAEFEVQKQKILQGV